MKIAGSHSTLFAALFLLLGALERPADAQLFGPRNPPMKKASELIHRQQGPTVNRGLESVITPDNSRVIISISNQRMYVKVGDQTYIDAPVSTGKRAGMTPTGSFHVMEKDPDHHSNVYGDFVDRGGRIVRSGVSTKVDSAPSGTHYVGALMKWFCRLTSGGVGMHVGILPGYPASHGCVCQRSDMALLVYQKVKVGTPVTIEP